MQCKFVEAAANGGAGAALRGLSGVYVLGLENNRVYVGESEDILARINAHMNANRGFTALNRPVGLLQVIPCEHTITRRSIEHSVTLQCMYIYGIDAVRGANYSQMVHPPNLLNVLTPSLCSIMGLCYTCKEEHSWRACTRPARGLTACDDCGGYGHVGSQPCLVSEAPHGCERCGWRAHFGSECTGLRELTCEVCQKVACHGCNY